MTPMIFAALAIAGGLGAACRFCVDAFIGRHLRSAFPWATFIINVSGSLVLGFLTALSTAALLPPEWALIAGAGFLGGYTTFSTNSHETLRLLAQRRLGASAMSAFGTLFACVAAAGVGAWLGSTL